MSLTLPKILSMLAAAILPLVGSAAQPAPEYRADRLSNLVALTPSQHAQATDVFRLEDRELAAVSQANRPVQGMDARQASRDRIRALLTSAQQKIYDRTPQPNGGGLTVAQPDNKVSRLDQQVVLSPAQRQVAQEVYQEEFEGLVSLAPAERLEKGMPFRQAAREQIRALLTPEQLAKMEDDQQSQLAQSADERKELEDALRAVQGLSVRIGSVVKLSIASYTSSQDQRAKLKSGTWTGRVLGSTGAETVTVTWQKDLPAGAVRILRVVGSNGEMIPL